MEVSAVMMLRYSHNVLEQLIIWYAEGLHIFPLSGDAHAESPL